MSTTTVNVGHKGPVGSRTTTNPASAKLREDASAARQTLIGLCVKIVEGKTVKDAELTQARLAADCSASEVARMIDTLTARKTLADAHQSHDHPARIKEQEEAKAEAFEEHRDLEKQLAQLRELTSDAHERYVRSIQLASTYRRLQDESLRNMTAELSKTGGSNDWKAIR